MDIIDMLLMKNDKEAYMNSNRKIARKHTDNNEKIRVHFALGRIDEGKRNAMKIINKEEKNETF